MDQKKLTIAYHETGHAVMALLCRQKVQVISLKEMISPRGTSKYLGFTRLERAEHAGGKPIEQAISQIRIALAGGVGEGLFADGLARIAEDDMARAIDEVEKILKWDEGAKDRIALMPAPPPDAFGMIENQLVRTVVVNMVNECFEIMMPLKPLLKSIAHELLAREELTGDDVSELLNLHLNSRC